MSNSRKYDPEILTATVNSSVSTLTPTYKSGTAIIENLDAANSVYVTWDGTTPAAGFGNGGYQLNAGKALNLNLEEIDTIKAICSGSDTVNLQAVVWPSTGSDRSM